MRPLHCAEPAELAPFILRCNAVVVVLFCHGCIDQWQLVRTGLEVSDGAFQNWEGVVLFAEAINCAANVTDHISSERIQFGVVGKLQFLRGNFRLPESTYFVNEGMNRVDADVAANEFPFAVPNWGVR